MENMMKKSVVILFCMFLLSGLLCSIVLAQSNNIEISLTKESFQPGEKVTFKVSLFDSENNPIDDDVNVVIEDAGKFKTIEQLISSNKLVDIDLGENAPSGYWKITATYKDNEINELFMVVASELAEFQLDNDILTVINIGNTRYTKNIQIIIGDEIMPPKEVDLFVGESLTFRLIAPDGEYDVQISDGKTTLTRSDVLLTGQAVGILDERMGEGSPLTGGVKPEEGQEGLFTNLGRNSFVFIFIFIVIGAMILLTIERRLKKKYEENA